MTQTIEQRARELLARQLEIGLYHDDAERVRAAQDGLGVICAASALAALTEALTERDKLHALLVAVVNDGTDGFAADAVSLEFLSHVPAEVKAMKSERDALRATPSKGITE